MEPNLQTRTVTAILANSEAASSPTDPYLDPVVRSLQAARPEWLWLWIQDLATGAWNPIQDLADSTDRSDVPPDPERGELPDGIQACLATQLTSAMPPGGPLTVDWGEAGQLLIVPLTTPSGPVAITLLARSEPPAALRELASLAVASAEQDRQIEQLQSEFEIYTAQITDDFEELSFLRNIAQQLESSDLTKGLMDMAQTVLPLLRTSIKAQAIVLMLPGEADRSGKVATAGLRTCGDPALWCGPRHVGEDVCRRIVRTFHRPSETRAVVRNLYHSPREAALLPGVESFILSPIVKAGLHMGWLLAINRSYRRGFEDVHRLTHMVHHEFGTAEAGLVSSAASMLASQGRNFELYREREELLVKVVRSLVSAIEAKDPYTCGHSERVALFGRALAAEFGQSTGDCERIYLAGLLHDVGKIGVSDKTLNKPGKLTPEEFNEVKTHPEKGWSILNELDQLRYVLPGVIHHHERVDGRGYPDGLSGDDVPLDGRILAVADAYDAMTSDRPYRNGMPVEKAFAILNEGAGTQWDARLIEAFNRIRSQILEIQGSYQRSIQPRRAVAGAE